MCGFAVSLRRGAPIDLSRLRTALHRLGHRGPNASGLVLSDVRDGDGAILAQAGFAHARLAILDLDPRANQPFRIGQHLLAYNGEIYNYRALSAGLETRTTGDTEVLLKLLMRGGTAELACANGMWAFCWLDEKRGRLVAGRDRYGKKPLFYAFDHDSLHLASEPAALADLTGRPLVLRQEAMDRFMADGWLFPDPSGGTHLDGIREVPPGHALTFDMQSWTLTVAPAFPFPDDDGETGTDYSDASLARLLAESVEDRLVSDRRVGLFLSGGVDSSLILSILHARGLADNVVCITGDAGKSDDARYAEACIQQLGIAALRVPMPYGAVGLEQFLSVCQAQAKPFPLIGNVLGMHALYKAVKEQDVPVVLDGSGADEVFGGYWYRYFGFARRDALAAGDTQWLASIEPQMPRSFAGVDEAQGWMVPREGLDAQALQLLRPAARRDVEPTPPHDPLLGFDGTLAEALHRDATAGRMQEWLWQNDRNAMAASIENRSPFLDYRLARFMQAPRATKFDGPWNKPALRAMFAHFTPLPTAARRDKQGFRWSFSRFFDQNKDALAALLAGSGMVSRYVDAGAFVDGFRSGRVAHDNPVLHRLTVLAGLEASGLSGAD